MLDKLASWDTIDFSSSTDAEITKILKELNIPAEIGVTRGLYAPKGTPKDVMEKLSQIMEKAALAVFNKDTEK